MSETPHVLIGREAESRQEVGLGFRTSCPLSPAPTSSCKAPPPEGGSTVSPKLKQLHLLGATCSNPCAYEGHLILKPQEIHQVSNPRDLEAIIASKLDGWPWLILRITRAGSGFNPSLYPFLDLRVPTGHASVGESAPEP